MVEYIDRQAVLDELDEDIEDFVECDYALKTAKKYIKKIPPADARPVKHGKWIVKTDSEGKTYGVCSRCGYEQYAGHLKYCPECGGKMDGPNQQTRSHTLTQTKLRRLTQRHR